MEKLFFRYPVLAESLAVNAIPKIRPEVCPFCKSYIASALGTSNRIEINCHDIWVDYNFCLQCGWWDMIYREDDMMGNNEEEGYYWSTLTDLSSQQISFLSEIAEINNLSHNPMKLYNLPSRKIETLIASIYRNLMDCDVEITKSTRDGGKDILGFNSNYGKFIVEVKRYKKTKKVDISLVRQLLGVMCFDNISRGVFVTTSSYTKPAQDFANNVTDKTKWHLELRDFEDIKNWLRLSFERYFDLNYLDSIVASIIYGGCEKFPRKFLDKNGIMYEF